MHPNGQLPAYEWDFGDANPPVHAWAAMTVWRIDRRRREAQGLGPDNDFLERMFHKLIINFTWWVNRKDREGNNVFEGGFLGLDNIGLFDRSRPPSSAGVLEQSDGTAWMATYCLTLLEMALRLADMDPNYEDVAIKFYEHYSYIAAAMHKRALGRRRRLFLRCDPLPRRELDPGQGAFHGGRRTRAGCHHPAPGPGRQAPRVHATGAVV